MNRYSNPAAAVALVLVAAGCAGASAAGRPPASASGGRAGVVTVAVFEFEDHSLDADTAALGLGRTVAERIGRDLAEQGGLRLVEREAIEQILNELALASGALSEAETRLRLGRLLGAQYFVFGGFTALGGAVRIDGRVVAVETGVAEGASVAGALARRTELEDAIAGRVAATLSARLGAPAGTPTMAEYLRRGLTLERRGDWRGAQAMYQQALALDPANAAARERFEALLLKEIE